jgi:mannose-1-phosphate guanylyltransferase / phosphomannomutase
MRVFVMAAGIGTRLRPLTYVVPKPMVPVGNRPVMEYTIELLRKHGIKDIIVNLHFKPDFIKNYFGDGEKWGVNIDYSFEKKLMGTAGGIKKMEGLLRDDTFLVMSGDGLTDINLTKLIKYHKKKKGIMTIVLKGVNARLEYGLAAANKSSRIMKFIEKPGWKEVFHGAGAGINTGIYVFEPEIFKYITKGKEVDFAKNVFPALLKSREKIFGYYADEYWCDIGDLSQYRMAQRVILEGGVKARLEGEKISALRLRKGKILVGKGCEVDPSSRLSGPILIGNYCKIKKNVEISGATILGNNSLADEGAILHNCIIWDNAYIGKGVRIQNCIIGNNASVVKSISMYDGIVQLGE